MSGSEKDTDITTHVPCFLAHQATWRSLEEKVGFPFLSVSALPGLLAAGEVDVEQYLQAESSAHFRGQVDCYRFSHAQLCFSNPTKLW